eukprot:1457899-Prymnesium_polylepis.1
MEGWEAIEGHGGDAAGRPKASRVAEARVAMERVEVAGAREREACGTRAVCGRHTGGSGERSYPHHGGGECSGEARGRGGEGGGAEG